VNRQIRLLGIGMIGLFTLLFAQLNYLQVVRADKLNHNPLNNRIAAAKFVTKRGDLLTADGVVLAHSNPSSDQYKWQRVYPQKDLFADVTGFFSFTYGEDGAEKSFDAELTGANAPFRLPRSLKDLTVQQDKSQSVTLTLSAKLQQVARTALGTRKGAVVALNPSTGAVLALWSWPSYDPNPLAAHDQLTVRDAWQADNTDPNQPFLPRAYRQRYFPGSTFKMITSSAVFDHSPDLATKPYPVLSALPLPQTNGQVLSNFAGERCGGVLADLFKVSCNTGFAQIGLDLGAANLAAEANAFGFNKVPPLDLPAAAKAFFPDAASFQHDLPGLAKSAIGQQDVSSTPLEMALVASAFANNGVIMQPHVLQDVRDSEGKVVRTYQPSQWVQATSAQTAAAMTALMISVVQGGTGTAAQVPGVQVAGKTGTAQTGLNTVHTWFVAFAPASKPTIAVAVIVESRPAVNEATGGAIAAPIAKAVIQSALAGP
jgi:peptidoglycan glycosyltransferase